MMNIVVFGATGMVGQGVLRECLLAADVARVIAVGRTSTGVRDAKLEEIVKSDLYEYASVDEHLRGIDACFFCLGTSSFRMNEADYTRITFDLTLAAARALQRLNPHMTFVYVSGSGADSSEVGTTMWARVRGRTENALLKLPFANVSIFRPAVIQALHGARSRTAHYRWIYALAWPLFALLKLVMPRSVLTTEMIGRAMLAIARRGANARSGVLEVGDIYDIAMQREAAPLAT